MVYYPAGASPLKISLFDQSSRRLKFRENPSSQTRASQVGNLWDLVG